MTKTLVRNPDNEAHARFSHRLQWLTLIIGFSGALAAVYLKSARAGCGVALGTLLAWLNYRWMDQGLGALVNAAIAQQSVPQPRVPLSVPVKFGGRYLLIGLAVYVIVSYFGVPLLAVLLGLLALGAGAIVEGLYEVISGSA